MTTPTKPRRRFTAQQKAEAVELCLQEDLSCNAVAHRLGLPLSSLARWVRQGRIDRGQAGPKDQGLLSTQERDGDFQERCRRSAPIQAACWKSNACSSVESSVGSLIQTTAGCFQQRTDRDQRRGWCSLARS